MRIGSHLLKNGLFVAPMAGVSDRAWRRLCRRYGAGLAISEMVGVGRQLRDTEKSRRRRNHDGETGPISVQIVGNDPQAMAEAARFNAGEGALAQLLDHGLEQVPEQLSRWVHAHDQEGNLITVEALVSRRAAEVELWNS